MEKDILKDWLSGRDVSDEDIKSITPYLISAQLRVVDEDAEYLRMASYLEENKDIIFASVGIKKEEIFEAAPSMVVDGKPRMIHISGFIAHEGFNNNRDGFVAEELQAVVESKRLFKGAYAGILDHNHSLNPIGYWYDAEYTFDPQANKNGILAHGAIWAWRFKETSDLLLAEQVRENKINISMACLSKDVEPMQTETGLMGSILHQPIFVATSVLTEAPPADFYGRAVIEDESGKTSTYDRGKLVSKVAMSSHNNNNNMEVELMDKEELMNAIHEALGKSDESVVEKVKDVIEASVSEFKTELISKDTSLTEATNKITELEATIAELNGAAEDKDLTFSALKDQHDTLETKVAELEAELSVYHEAEEATRVSELRAARLAQVGTAIHAKLDDMDEEKKESLISRWAALSDEEWAVRVEELNLASQSGEEPHKPVKPGVFPNVSPAIKTNVLDKFIKR